jgi:hypothetical protein
LYSLTREELGSSFKTIFKAHVCHKKRSYVQSSSKTFQRNRNVTGNNVNIQIVSPFLFGHFFGTVVITVAYTTIHRRYSLSGDALKAEHVASNRQNSTFPSLAL